MTYIEMKEGPKNRSNTKVIQKKESICSSTEIDDKFSMQQHWNENENNQIEPSMLVID